MKKSIFKTCTKNKSLAVLLLAVPLLMACEAPDSAMMSSGLTKSGMPVALANCMAEAMSESIDAEVFNSLAALLDKGVAEKEAVNRTRRKFGAEFRTPMNKARAACVTN